MTSSHAFSDLYSPCDFCNGRDGTLTIDCPKRPLSGSEKHSILMGNLDFRDNKWFNPKEEERKKDIS